MLRVLSAMRCSVRLSHALSTTASKDESIQTMRSRLIYQSKKRGILENDIILGQFAEQRLEALDRPTLESYDKFIYGSDMECDLYYLLPERREADPCAMPFKSMKIELIERENVGGVVCCTEEFELKAAYEAMREDDWEESGVKWHGVPMTDFFRSAARAEIAADVDFIESVTSQGKTVYAGRIRSATIPTCYLMKSRNWLPNVAFEFLKSQRPQVLLRSAHWRTANEYRRFLDRQSPLQSK